MVAHQIKMKQKKSSKLIVGNTFDRSNNCKIQLSCLDISIANHEQKNLSSISMRDQILFSFTNLKEEPKQM